MMLGFGFGVSAAFIAYSGASSRMVKRVMVFFMFEVNPDSMMQRSETSPAGAANIFREVGERIIGSDNEIPVAA